MADKYFKILELNSNATLDDVESAYRSLITVWHPDRFQQNKDLRKKAEEKTKILNEAYSELKANFKAEQYFANKKNSSYSTNTSRENTSANQTRAKYHNAEQDRFNKNGQQQADGTKRASTSEKVNKYKEGKYKEERYKEEKKDSILKKIGLILFAFLFSFTIYKIYQDKSETKKTEKAIIKVVDGKQMLEFGANGKYKIVKIESDEATKNKFLKSVLTCNKLEVSKLLSSGEKINQVDSEGNTALIWAVRRGCEDLVKFLISKNANINLKSSNGFSPLMWANLYKREDIKKMLLRAGSKDLPQFWNK